MSQQSRLRPTFDAGEPVIDRVLRDAAHPYCTPVSDFHPQRAAVQTKPAIRGMFSHGAQRNKVQAGARFIAIPPTEVGCRRTTTMGSPQTNKGEPISNLDIPPFDSGCISIAYVEMECGVKIRVSMVRFRKPFRIELLSQMDSVSTPSPSMGSEGYSHLVANLRR